MTTGHVWQAFSRDAGANLTGPLPIVSAKGVQRHLGVDTCELVTTYAPDAYGRLAPGCGVVVQRDGVQQFSGMVGSSRKIEWNGETGEATISVQLLGDDQHLADRLVWPSPNRNADFQEADYWSHTGPASTAMWRLIDQQAGPSGMAYRNVPTLVMGDDPKVGTSRLWRAQWSNLLETLSLWGVLSRADLGVRVTSEPGAIRADVVAPRDLSSTVRFAASLTNLTGWSYEQAPPTVTYAIAAGEGKLRNRVRSYYAAWEAADMAWGRHIETYIDQRDVPAAEAEKLYQAAADAIDEGRGTTALSTVTADTPAAAYGVDWQLGDRVTVHVGIPGQPTAATVIDLVREVAFEVDSRGRETITPAVGSFDAQAVPQTAMQSRVKRQARQIGALGRNQ